jgi:crossover junction endodeoxyribonuclease RuvC
VGVVEAVGHRLLAVWHGRVRNPSERSHSACLLNLSQEIRRLIAEHQPQAVAIEGVFFAKNLRTTLILGEARGAVIAQSTLQGVPVYEYEPRRVKQAVVGYGNAGKEQVQRMVMSLLALPEAPQEDAADALALAICHLHNRTRLKLLAIEPL